MTGSLRKKNNKFHIVLSFYDEFGERKQKWISTGLDVKGNKKKAEQLLRETIASYESHQVNVPKDVLFADYIEVWLKRKEGKVDIVTYQGYCLLARKHIIPYFMDRKIKVTDIDRRMLQTYFDNLYENGRTKHGEHLSPDTIKHYKNIINQSLKEAVKDDLIPSNPCLYVELPKIEKHNSNFYSSNQIKALFEAISGDVLENLIKITVLYGLRRSEVLGLKWDSIDFETRRLEIKHTVVVMTAKVEKDKTKNNSSHRSFTLTPEAIAIFQEQRRKEEKNRKIHGKEYVENDYIFKWDNGRPFSTDYVTKHFSKLLKQHNLPHIRFHELRHSCASLLLNNGYTLKDVQEYMGHANIRMTADIYGHLDTARKATLAEGIANDIFQE